MSLRATDVGEHLTHTLRTSMFTHENHTPKGTLTRRLRWQLKMQPYGKLTQHACLTTPLRNLTEISCSAHPPHPHPHAPPTAIPHHSISGALARNGKVGYPARPTHQKMMGSRSLGRIPHFLVQRLPYPTIPFLK